MQKYPVCCGRLILNGDEAYIDCSSAGDLVQDHNQLQVALRLQVLFYVMQAFLFLRQCKALL